MKPLVCFDIEGTGVDPATDRIITLAAIRLDSDVPMMKREWMVFPGRSIPPESTEIHGITDERVKNCPPFVDVAKDIYQFLDGCDLVGFNLSNYDVPLLWEELYRAGIEWDLSTTNIIDVGTLFKKREERTLAAAMKFYCDAELVDAHNALADVGATLEVYDAMLERYPDFQRMSMEERAKESQFDQRLDLAGKIIVGKDGRPTYNIGKVKGTAVDDDRSFARWMLNRDFTTNTKMVLQRILDGVAV